MQRNRSSQNYLSSLLLVALYVLYVALSSSYTLLPPLLGLLFYYFVNSLDRGDDRLFLSILIMLLFLEVALGYFLLSSVIFFTLSYYTVLPKVRAVISNKLYFNLFLVSYAYIGFFWFMYLLSKIFAYESPIFSPSIALYIVVEFLLISLL